MAAIPLKKQIRENLVALCTALDTVWVNFFEERAQGKIYLSHKRCVVPTGTFACGVWSYGEDIRLVCVTDNSSTIFWESLKERLSIDASTKAESDETMELSSTEIIKTSPNCHPCLREFVSLSGKDMAGCRFYLHYCVFPKKYEAVSPQFANIETIMPIPGYRKRFRNSNMKRHLSMVRDMQILSEESEEREGQERRRLIAGFRNLRCWAKSHGLIGPKLGFLNSNEMIWLVHGAYQEEWSPQPSTLVDRAGHSILSAARHRFLRETYADMGMGTASDTTRTSNNYRIINVKQRCQWDNMTPEARAALQDAIVRSDSLPDLSKVVIKGNDIGFREFLDDFDYFLKIHCECWHSSLDLRATFQEITVPYNLNEVVAAFRDKEDNPQYGKISLRIWPVPVFATDDHRQQVFAIGIRPYGSAVYNVEPFKKRGAMISNEIMNDIFDYNPDLQLMAVELVNSDAFETYLTLKDEFARLNLEASNPLLPNVDPFAKNRDNWPVKFRDAHSAISRLRFDPKHEDIEYQVGYVDRFEEKLMWMALEMWGGKETEAIDFIPEHRIRVLRRADNWEVVWDRTKRIDLL